MPIARLADCVQLTDVVQVEDAETLLEWLQSDASLTVDLSECTHLHAANLQVMMAAARRIAGWPSHQALALWLRAALPAR